MPTPDEALTAAQAEYPGKAESVSPTHPGEDDQWWVADSYGDTFAVADYISDVWTFRDYIP